ncbi:GNAT family N-acetyltransferase [Caulobacter segnis]
MCVIEEEKPDHRDPAAGRCCASRPEADYRMRVAAFCVDHDVAAHDRALSLARHRGHAEDFVAGCGTQDRSRDNTFAVELADGGLIGVVGLFDPRPRRPGRDGLLDRLVPIGVAAMRPRRPRARWTGRAPPPGRSAGSSPATSHNDASGRVLVKAGFPYTGVVGDKPLDPPAASRAATRMMVLAELRSQLSSPLGRWLGSQRKPPR